MDSGRRGRDSPRPRRGGQAPEEIRGLRFLFDNFFELTFTGLVLGAVYGLVALGYTLVYGVLR